MSFEGQLRLNKNCIIILLRSRRSATQNYCPGIGVPQGAELSLNLFSNQQQKYSDPLTQYEYDFIKWYL